MPKEGQDFLKRVAELRRVFQQHVRDEKKELLPAVRKALSEEEAQGIVERIEADKAEVEQAKRQEARSEEHTSELQSRQYLVCRLLLETKKQNSQVQSRQ